MSIPRQRTPVASNISLALARGRLGVWPVVAIVMAAAAPLTVVAGGATTGYAVTGVVGIPVAYLAVAVVLGLFSVGYVAMSRKVVNGRVDHAARYLPRLALFRVVSLQTGRDGFPVIRLSSDYGVSVAAGCRSWM